MAQHDKEIGNHSFTFYTLPAFNAVTHLARLKGVMAKGAAGGLDAAALQLLAGLDEKFIPDVILPIFKDCNVVCTTAETKIVTPADINKVYDTETLDEFFELIAHVLWTNYGPLVKKTLARFGLHLDRFDAETIKKLASKLVSDKI